MILDALISAMPCVSVSEQTSTSMGSKWICACNFYKAKGVIQGAKQQFWPAPERPIRRAFGISEGTGFDGGEIPPVSDLRPYRVRDSSRKLPNLQGQRLKLHPIAAITAARLPGGQNGGFQNDPFSLANSQSFLPGALVWP